MKIRDLYLLFFIDRRMMRQIKNRVKAEISISSIRTNDYPQPQLADGFLGAQPSSRCCTKNAAAVAPLAWTMRSDCAKESTGLRAQAIRNERTCLTHTRRRRFMRRGLIAGWWMLRGWTTS